MKKLILAAALISLFVNPSLGNVTDKLLSSKAQLIEGEMLHIKAAVQSYMRFVSFLERTNNTAIRRPPMDMREFDLSWLQGALPAGEEISETSSYPEALGEVPNKAFLLTRSHRYNERIGQYRGEDIDFGKYVMDPAKQSIAEYCLSLPIMDSLGRFFSPPFIVRTDGGVTTADVHISMPQDTADMSQYLTTDGGAVTGTLVGDNLRVSADYLRIGSEPGDGEILFIRSMENLFVDIFALDTVDYFTLPYSERLRLQNLIVKYRDAFETGDAKKASYLFLRLHEDNDLKAFYDYIMAKFVDPEELYEALEIWNTKLIVGGKGINDFRKEKLQQRINSNMSYLKLDNLALTEGTYDIDIYAGNSEVLKAVYSDNFENILRGFYSSVVSNRKFKLPNLGLSSTVSGSENFFGEFVPDPSTFRFHIGGKKTTINADSALLNGSVAMSSQNTRGENLHVDGSLTATATSSIVFGHQPVIQGDVIYDQGFRSLPNVQINLDRLLFSDEPTIFKTSDSLKKLEIEPSGDVDFTGSGKLYVNGHRVSKYKISSYGVDRDKEFRIPIAMTGFLEGSVTMDELINDISAIYQQEQIDQEQLDDHVVHRFLSERWFNKYKRWISPYMTYEMTRYYDTDLVTYADIRKWTTNMNLMRNACREIPESILWLSSKGKSADDVVGLTGHFVVETNGLCPATSDKQYTIAENLNQFDYSFDVRYGKNRGSKIGGMADVYFYADHDDPETRIINYIYNGSSLSERGYLTTTSYLISSHPLSDEIYYGLSYLSLCDKYPIFGSTGDYNGLSSEEQVNLSFFDNALLKPFSFDFHLKGYNSGYDRANIVSWKYYFVPTIIYIREAK